jgi:predicted permease
VFYFANIPVPDAVDQLLTYISNITSGLSMIVVGLSLSRLPFRAVFEDKKMFLLAALRLLILPFAVIVILNVLPIELDQTLKSVLILTAALPASSAQSMIAEQYRTNTSAAGRAVFITTLFSVITVPIIMMFV